MSGPADLLRALKRHGPCTGAVLADLTSDHSGGVARSMAALIKAGKARRIDGKTGRGTIAIYEAIKL